MDVNNSNGDTLPNEEDEEIVNIPVIVQNFWHIKTPKDVQVPENIQDIRNDEISINNVSIGKRWNRLEIIIDNIFAYNITLDIMHENEDLKSRTIA